MTRIILSKEITMGVDVFDCAAALALVVKYGDRFL